MSFSCLVILRGCPPRHVPFHAFQFPPFMSLVFPLHFPCMSLSFIASHFSTSPSCPLVSLFFVCPAVPPHSPCFHCPLPVPFSSPSCPFQLPFVSFSFPLAFLSCQLPVPFMSLHFPLIPLLISLHFPFAPQYFSGKNTVFPTFSQKGCQQPGFRQKEAENLNQQRIGRGIRAWDPLFCDTGSPNSIFSGTSSDDHAVRAGPLTVRRGRNGSDCSDRRACLGLGDCSDTKVRQTGLGKARIGLIRLIGQIGQIGQLWRIRLESSRLGWSGLGSGGLG